MSSSPQTVRISVGILCENIAIIGTLIIHTNIKNVRNFIGLLRRKVLNNWLKKEHVIRSRTIPRETHKNNGKLETQRRLESFIEKVLHVLAPDFGLVAVLF